MTQDPWGDSEGRGCYLARARGRTEEVCHNLRRDGWVLYRNVQEGMSINLFKLDCLEEETLAT